MKNELKQYPLTCIVMIMHGEYNGGGAVLI